MGVAIAVPLMARHEHYAREYYESRRTVDCLKDAISPAERQDCAKDAQSRKDYTPWWDELFAWPSGIETLALIATLVGILWQAYETRRAANATAAGNRAWIFAELKKLGDRSFSNTTGRSLGRDEPSATYLLASLHIRNEGLSPAWIDSVHGHMEILPRKQNPPRRVKLTLCPYVSTIMSKGQEVFNPEFECSGNFTREADNLFIWVIIKYHDGHGIEGETSLGYAMSLSGMLFRQTYFPMRNYNK
jgi:hypothetical protein